MLKRLNGWPEALASALEHARNEPFRWGQNDCCLFAAYCAKAITGRDLAIQFRGYQTRAEAAEILESFGGLYRLASIVARAHGAPEIPPLQARRGDICLLKGREGPMLGVCIGDKIVAPGESGLVSYPISKGHHAWGIG
jgi:hypothetical protein